MNKNTAILLVDKHMGKTSVHGKVDIVLTPSLYWIKRAFFELHFAAQALKYAPSVFEGSLPEGNYAYYALKQNKEYLLFAYDPDEIIATLEKCGIASSQIGNVYFAQNELAQISAPVKCNENDVLVSHNETIIQIPRSLVELSSIQDEIGEIKKLSKHKIALYKSSLRHSFKTLTPAFSILGALIVLYAVQLFFTYHEYSKVSDLPSVFQEYKLPPTSLQNASIEKKLLSDFKAQESFRKLTNAILKLPLSPAQRVQSIAYEKDLFKIVFDTQDKKALNELKIHIENSMGKRVEEVKVEKNTMRIKIL
ncbi:MAG: hypothetical protein IBX43_10640 [Campylobacterales bacterium]|nr:hypothetical protein [Campylobacterales bacterium]